MKDLILITTSFVNDQVIMASRVDEKQRAVYSLNNIAIKYNLKISVNKTKTMPMNRKMNVRTKIVIITYFNKQIVLIT
jgi:hypothetical protein